MGLSRNFIRNTEYAYTSRRADILPASPQNLSLVLTVDSDVMMKGYIASQHDHRAEEQQGNVRTSHPELQAATGISVLYINKRSSCEWLQPAMPAGN